MTARVTAERTLSRKTPTRPKKSRAVSRPATSPQLASQLERLVEVVTQADESRREQAVSHVLKNCIPQALALLCERLARRLGGLPGARAAPVRLGRAALPALTHELRQPGSRAVRVGLIEVVAEIGGKLPATERVELMEELVIVQRLGGDEAVGRAVAEAITRLRRLDR